MQLTIIQNRIYEIRSVKVMLDFDIAELYQIETKRLNEQVKRNKDRFPIDFMFRLTKKEWNSMRSQFVTSSSQDVDFNQSTDMRSQIATASKKRNVSATPYAFSEHGVTMLSNVLKSDRAVKMSIAIVRAFIALRQFAINYDKLSKEIQQLKEITGSHNIQLNQIYDALKNLMAEKADQKTWKERDKIGFKTNKKITNVITTINKSKLRHGL